MFSQGEDEDCVFNPFQDFPKIKTPCPWAIIVLAHQEVKILKGAKKGTVLVTYCRFCRFLDTLDWTFYWFVDNLNLTEKDFSTDIWLRQ